MVHILHAETHKRNRYYSLTVQQRLRGIHDHRHELSSGLQREHERVGVTPVYEHVAQRVEHEQLRANSRRQKERKWQVSQHMKKQRLHKRTR